MTTVQLSPPVLSWAAEQAGKTVDEIARKISVKKSAKIADGEMTPGQAAKFAKETGVPFGYLFLDEPPADRPLAIADFRTLPDSSPLGRDFFQTYDDIEFKQAWYRSYLESEAASKLAFVGRFANSDAPPSEVANDIRDELGLTDSNIWVAHNAEELFDLIARRAEARGVLVFKNGIVGNNTHRALSVKEFRGFALSDPVVPVIFINGADAPAACVFTLAHELAHIWKGESGVSDVSTSPQNRAEVFCNSAAAEILIPQARFLELWDATTGTTDNKIEAIRATVKVSKYVIARRALDMSRISQVEFNLVYQDTRREFAASRAKGSGGNFYFTLPIRNSRRFSAFVAALTVRGGISYREAANLLNTKPSNVVTFTTI